MCITPLVAWRGGRYIFALRAVAEQATGMSTMVVRTSSTTSGRTEPEGPEFIHTIPTSPYLIPFLSISVHIRSCPGQHMSTHVNTDPELQLTLMDINAVYS